MNKKFKIDYFKIVFDCVVYFFIMCGVLFFRLLFDNDITTIEEQKEVAKMTIAMSYPILLFLMSGYQFLSKGNWFYTYDFSDLDKYIDSKLHKLNKGDIEND